MTDFDDVKQALDPAEVARHYGAAMKGRFANPSPCCGHNDCCSISSEDRVWKCHSCGKGGSVIDLIMEVDGVEKRGALSKAAELAGIEIAGGLGSGTRARKGEGAQEQVYRLTAEYYHAAMLNGSGKAGRDWFLSMRGHKESTLKKMQVGFADGKLLDHLGEHGYSPADVIKYGLATDRDPKGKVIKPRDYFWKGLAVFPIVDHDGRVISFTSKDPSKKYPGLLLKGAGKKWFINYAALGRYDELFVVEGENDVASLMDVGCDNVVGTAGGPGKEQVTLLQNFCAGKTVYLWEEKDKQTDWRKPTGGQRFVRFFYEALKESSVNVRIIVHPGDAKDPDDYVRGLG